MGVTVSWEIREGDCIEVMRAMPESSIDSIVCDPPYGIGFMGHEWDQPGEFGPLASAGNPADFAGGRPDAGPHVAGKQRRQHKPESGAGHARERSRRNTQGTGGKREGAKFGGPTGADNTTHTIRGGAMHAGRYDLSRTANQRFQAWCEAWAIEALRVLKPGGHLLASGGTRTYHRLTAGIEDAGFEVRDGLLWIYGSGFPKSLNLDGENEGWGTALKPGHEPIVVARKPLVGTVAANVLEHGTGALNIDGCRIGTAARPVMERTETVVAAKAMSGESTGATASGETTTLGRWPANVVLSHNEDCVCVGEQTVKGDSRETGNGRRAGGFADVGSENGDGEPNAPVYGDETVEAWECAPGCPVAVLDEQSGESRSIGGRIGNAGGGAVENLPTGIFTPGDPGYGDAGGASRFFYCAKASRAERNAGLSELPASAEHLTTTPTSTIHTGRAGGKRIDDRVYIPQPRANVHPTVKPIDLMRWLVRLITPGGGLVLDPFSGSGTTGCAAVLEGFEFIGVEREAEYVAIAEARIAWWAAHPEGVETAKLYTAERKRAETAAAGQAGLFDEAAA